MNQIVFLKPGIFWALLFIGIILLIHFLKRPSTVHLEFSTLRFFTSQALKSKKSRSINRILLLLARCLLVAVIVLIFTRPYRKNDPFSMINDQLTKVKIWIDQSPSMSYLDDNNRSTLQAAFEIVDSLKHSVTYPSNITVYNHKRRDFLPAADNNEFNLEVTHGASFCDAFAKANVENQIEKTVFIVISDFQDPLAQTIDSLLKIDSLRCNIICLPLIPPEPYNYFLNDARLNSGADHVVSCKVHSSGRALVNGVVSVSFGGLKTGSTEVNVDADRIFEVNVSGKTHQPTSSGTVQLLTKDPLLFDNYAFFTLNNQSSLRIMIVGDVKKNFVLSAALKNTGMNNTTILLREGNEITYDELDSADVIFVNELDNYSEPLEAYLKGHTDGNKLIVFCLGTDDNVFGYEISVLSKIFKNNISREFSNRPLFPVLPDTVSELWRGFQSKFCTDVSIYNYCRNIPGEPVLKLKNGSTLISRLKDPDGCVWIVAASS
ncbi:MAG: hypothetical protein GX640_13275, partial [Fibrobacter sp.]|nr:hypothetical protein [Fibrobacter sp.]